VFARHAQLIALVDNVQRSRQSAAVAPDLDGAVEHIENDRHVIRKLIGVSPQRAQRRHQVLRLTRRADPIAVDEDFRVLQQRRLVLGKFRRKRLFVVEQQHVESIVC